MRPAPTRPIPLNPSPTKRIPSTTIISARDLLSRITRIRNAVKAKDWNKANLETNSMATDLARYKPPTGKKVSGITDMAKFDAEYARLQADVKTKNATKTLDDLKRMEKMIKTGTS